MCGFVGIFSRNGSIDTTKAANALLSIRHRGPDASNTKTDGSSYFLGHNRLSIIDLSDKANQPFISSNNEFFILFNGEIYNYQELRKDIEHNWRTTSDTEVVLEGFLRYGQAFLSKLRGMYAFVVGELKPNGRLWLVRDPVGIKPLYVYKTAETLITASELKAIKTYAGKDLSINEMALRSYIHTGYISEPHTAYLEIEAVEPGFCYELYEGKWMRNCFYSFNYDSYGNAPVAYNKLENHLNTAVKRNLVADIDLSVALSGGIDSSLIYFLAHEKNPEIEAITVTSKDVEYNEADISQAYADFVKGKIKTVKVEDDFNLELLHGLMDQFDQPFCDTSLIPVYYLTRSASKYTKVLLAGDGGDEIFNGYPFMHYSRFLAENKTAAFTIKAISFLNGILPANANRLMGRLQGVAGKTINHALFNINAWMPATLTYEDKSIFMHDPLETINYHFSLGSYDAPLTPEGNIIHYSFRKILLSDYLRKTDMMSMLNSIELRVPMLDEDLCSFAFSIPFTKKSSLFNTKIPLRKIHKKFYSGLGSNLAKKGFRIPLDKYLNESEKKEMVNVLLKSDSGIRQFITQPYIQFLCNQFLNFSSPHLVSPSSVYQRIFLLYSLERWLTKH